MMIRKSIIAFMVIAVFSALGSSAGFSAGKDDTYTATKVENGGTITGKVIFDGEIPVPKQIQVTKDTKVCGKHKVDESLLVDKNTKGIKNAVVYLKDVQSGKSWQIAGKDLAIDQKGCRFSPHVLVVPAGQPFMVLNSDGILHNIHTRSERNPMVNKAQPKFLKKMKLTFEEPEFVQVACDVHNWMHGWIVVAPHPYYAVTDDSGEFQLTDVPPGTYTLQIWHETLGSQSKTVEVKAGGTTNLTVTMQ
ncbi:MAG: hypothetical protein D6743_11745 [Calditrichaeota bacterium]|nr:MAG: hypothetical protein D6743_11745 [Calditrichota bacterium]